MTNKNAKATERTKFVKRFKTFALMRQFFADRISFPSIATSAVTALPLIFAITCFPALSNAQTETSQQQAAPIPFAALVQYVAGSVVLLGPEGERLPLAFRSPLYANDRFRLSDSSKLKIVTNENCIGVIYGPGQAQAPRPDQPWRIRARALRWICPPERKSAVSLREGGLEITGGEFFLEGNQLLVLRPGVKARGSNQELSPGLVYQRVGKAWEAPDTTSDPMEAWEFNLRHPPPRESLTLAKPERPRNHRILFSPLDGSAWAFFDHHELDQDLPDLDGVRLQWHRRQANGSLIFALSFASKQDNHQDYRDPYFHGSSYRSKIEQFSLEAGFRYHHDRVFSPYVRAGLAFPKAMIEATLANPFLYERTEYEFNALTAAAGVDAIYFPPWGKTLGFYGALEANLTQSLWRGAKRVFNRDTGYRDPFTNQPESVAKEPWRLSEVDLQFALGLVLQL